MRQIRSIKKRDGSIVSFDPMKIENAICLASVATPEETMSTTDLKKLTASVVERLPNVEIPSVEQVQDLVEEALIYAGFAKTAKAYILYRAEHAKRRRDGEELMRIFRELTFSMASDADIKRENANIDADTAMGTMLKYGSESAKYFVDNEILPSDISQAHLQGDIHIHDKDFYMLTETCCQIDLIKLFKGGFSTGHGVLREPSGITSYAALACIAIQANQNEMHGGQSIPNFDYAMAKGVAGTYVSSYYRALAQELMGAFGWDVRSAGAFADGIRMAMQNETDFFKSSVTTPAMGNIDAFGQELKRLFAVLPKDFAAHLPSDAGQHYAGAPARSDFVGNVSVLPETFDPETVSRMHERAQQIALMNTERLTYQAMEALIHNLNTMNSRAGAQVPFSSVNYGTDTSPEGRLLMKNLLLATDAGLGGGETPIFPVQIFKVKEGVNYNPEDPNYDLFKLAMKTSAKRLFPNFSFMDAPFNLQYYKAGDPDTEVAYMGCRTRVMGNYYDPSREITPGRGNLSFTSINLPRIAIEANHDMAQFYRLLDERMHLCFRQLRHRYEIQSRRKCRNYPFLMGQGIWIDSDSLDPDDSIGEVLKHGTLSVGFIGLAETLVALIGEHHGKSEKARALGLEIVTHMRDLCDQETRAYKMNYTLLATPAEGLSGRFVRLDRARYGSIAGVTDRDYYTNSFHVPVYYPIRAFDKIRIEGPYHALTNAGHISYVELDGDVAMNLEAFEAVIRCMKESGIGYGSVNHPVDRDPVCGYTGIIGECCPRCGRRDGEAVSVEKLRELKKKYPHMPDFYGLV